MKKTSQSAITLVKQAASPLFSYSLIAYSIYCVGYLLWRLKFTMLWGTPYAYGLYLLDIYIFFSTIMFLVTNKNIYIPKFMPALEGKTVDIFIPTYNEPIEIVEMTALAALQVKGHNKVYILDDGNRHKVKEMANKIGADYLARTTNTHAKAGNLNHALEHSTAEYILCLDCDHIPSKHIIERLLGYFKDPKMGFVQTPQVFYNFNSIQHAPGAHFPLWNEQTMFYESIQPGKNNYNAAFFCGSGALLRRKALDSIGGFATGTATEDIHTSIRLHAHGWSSLFINEKLAFGLAAEDLAEYHKQRVRWGAGSLGLLFRSKDSPAIIRGLSLGQRICYINSTLAHSYGVQKFFYYLAPILALLSIKVLPASEILIYFLIYYIHLIFSYAITYSFGRGTFQLFSTEMYDVMNIFAHLEAIKGIIKIQKKFGVSLKVKKKYENHYSYYGLIVIVSFLITINAILLRHYAVNGNELSILLRSTLIISTFWNAFNVYFLSKTIYFLWKYNKKNRLKYRFLVEQTGYIHGIHTPVLVHSLSYSGAILTCKDSLPNAITLQLKSSASLSLYGRVVRRDHKSSQYEVKFTPLLLEQKKLLVPYLLRAIQKHWKVSESRADEEVTENRNFVLEKLAISPRY